MKKFKNKLLITGPISLLKAFKEELLLLGYFDSSLQLNNNHKCFYVNHDYESELCQILQLPQDWGLALKLASQVKEEVFKPKVGKWYKDKVLGDILVYCKKISNNGDIIGYGFQSDNQWSNDNKVWFGKSFSKYIIPATNEEVNAKLMSYAKEKYKNAKLILCARYQNDSPTKWNFKGIGNIKFKSDLDFKNNILSNANTSYLFYHGIWAEILSYNTEEDESIITRINSQNVKVGAITYDIRDLIKLEDFIRKYYIDKKE